MVRGHERQARAERIRSRVDFRRIGQQGRRAASGCFVVLAAPPWEGAPRGGRRLGITVTRRVGKAVVRNRLKRYVREGFRKQRSILPVGMDVVVVARSAAVSLGASEVEEELRRLFESL